MNSCNFIGRLVNDPTTQRYQYGDKIIPTSYFNLAVERIVCTGKQTYDSLPMKATGTLAETCEKWLIKGKKIGVSCRAVHTKKKGKNGRWYEDTIFQVTNLYFVDAKPDQPNVVSDDYEVKQLQLDTSGLEETEYQDIDFSALD
jgi:single-stranded DNA-binding protein